MATATGTRSVEDVLRAGGFTRFHRRIVLLTGFAWTFVAFEIINISFVLSAVFADFGIPSDSLAYFAITSATLVGSFIGSLVLGRVSDIRGRRQVFLGSILWYSVFTALTAASWDAYSLFSLRLLAGLGLGGMLVVDPAILSEFLPPQSRGRYMVLLDFFWPIGFLVAILFWWVFIIQGVTVAGLASWRVLFVVAAFPAFIAFVARLAIPESPFYYARHGRLKESAEVLSRISNTPVDPATLSREQTVPRAPLASLFQGRLARRSVVTLVVWTALNFSYYGLFLTLPFDLSVASQFSDVGLLASFFIVSAVAQFPGYLASMILVERWGRKRTLALFLILGGVSGFAFATAGEIVVLFASLAFVSFFNLGAWGAVYAYTPELFPTQYRATGFGMGETVGKITAIFASPLFFVIYTATGGVLVPLAVIAVVMAVGGLFLAGVGPETKGQTFE